MFRKILYRLLSAALVLILLAQMLPAEVLASTGTGTESVTAEAAVQPEVVAEVPSGRSRYGKEFKLRGGLHLAVLYPEPVHYQVDGQWVEIDTTLKRSGNLYTNTAGDWQVSLPATLGTGGAVSVTWDGYTVSFRMAGELRSSGNLELMGAEEQYSVQAAQNASAQVQTIDLTEIRAAAEHPETISDKLQSRLRYDGVYTNTDIVYDVTPSRLKESIVMESFSSTLMGYRFTLETGDLTPVLTEDGQIGLFAPGSKEPVMTMPAPFLFDSNETHNYDVDVELTGSNGTYTLTYRLPTAWLASQDRQWPVTLDPVIETEAYYQDVEDRTVYKYASSTPLDRVLNCGYEANCGPMRIYMRYNALPNLTSSDVIVHAEIELFAPEKYGAASSIEVHKVNGNWTSSGITWDTQPAYDTTIVDYDVCGSAQTFYKWEITDIVRDWYAGENTGMMFKASDDVEAAKVSNWLRFYSSDFDVACKPVLSISFRNNNGLESYWDYTSASAGRAGTGYVNNYTGNLVWIRSDMGFGGSRMPVSISHVYNANDAASNNFGLGCGWRTNYNQRVYVWSEDSSYYVWEDSDGTRHYFKASGTSYEDEDGLALILTTTGSGTTKYCITDKYGNRSWFDDSGRLTKLQNNQSTPSSVTITYGTGNRIATITDGVGRVYRFTYNTSNLLTRISFYGKGSKELFYTAYDYSGSQLISVTHKDGETVAYTYTTGNLLASAQDIDGYKLTFDYNLIVSGKPSRIQKICEYSGSTAGGELTFEYAHNQTSVTDVNGNKQIYQFNNWGNTLSVQDGEGRAQYGRYATDSSTSGKANQLSMSSRLQNTVGNVLYDASFEKNSTWTVTSSAVSRSVVSSTAHYGSKSLKLTRSAAGTAAGVYSSAFTVGAGETYTFSAWVKTESASTAYLALTDGSKTEVSETLKAGSGWTRLQVSYTNTTTASKSVTARLLTATAGSVYMDAAQVEKAPTASRFNLIENGDFRSDTSGWDSSSNMTVVTSTSAAPQLDTHAAQIAGSYTSAKRVSQTVYVNGAAGDTLVLAGWAKGDAVPHTDASRKFGLLLTFTYTDGTTATQEVLFNPDTDSTVSWQYASAPMVAAKAFSSVTVSLAYDCNANTALFDGIQLYKEQFGSSYTYDANGNVTSVKDVQGQTTTYQYTNNNLTKEILPTGAALTYTYDNWHNVKTATTAEGEVYTFTYDVYGNNTKVQITGSGLTISSSAAYTADYNRIASVTDALGKVTKYSYNENTNVLEWVQYPKDSEATRTNYTYDAMYRASKVTSVLSGSTALTVSYGYTDDYLTSVTTGSTTYGFTYGAFGLRSAVKIGSRTLAEYTYTSDQNLYLSQLKYGNGDTVSYTYDDLGRVTKETFEDGDTVTYAYDNTGALATVTDSATGWTTSYYYDFTDRLMKYAEKGVDYSHSVGYTYDKINNLTAMVETINGTTRTTSYTYDNDNRVTSVSTNGVSRTYTYDALGRVSQRVSGTASGSVITETFTYTAPSSTATSGQVKTMRVKGTGFDITYTYTYDANGNILSVSDGTSTTTYVYDAANQLVRENNQAGGFTHVWTYDDAGNILTRTEYAYTTGTLGTATDTVSYTYSDSTWGDLLTAYDGQSITCDTIGNPTSYYNGTRWSFSWEHGRELTTASDGTSTWTYTYDADGLRTRRTNGTKTYNYIYNGGTLSQMTVGSDTLTFTYDASGRPLSVSLNGTTYYYATNLQGDVTAILNASGTAVVNYTYDAWGNPLSTTGTLATTLGTLNPLRYRGYVYDTETGLYYLQSRYYDPEVGRFLNADAFTATGQGLLGNNMFAYCLCNPICLSDNTGRSAIVPVPSLIDYYGMHKQVQFDIAEDYGWAIEVYVKGPKGRGYLDLYDGSTNQYYEVKHKRAAYGSHFDNQMKKYDSAYVAGWRFSEYTNGFGDKLNRGQKIFSGYTEYKFWDIRYRSNGDGLVTYTWVLNEERYALHLATVALVVVAAASNMSHNGVGQGMVRKNLSY